jgi:hypothetical protein
LGLLTGVAVSALYSLALIGFFTVSALAGALVTAPSNPQDAAMMALVAPASAGLMLICANFIGLLPGAILGLLIGALIGLSVGLLRRYLTPARAAGVGVVVSAGVVVIIHVLLLQADPDPTVGEYLLLTIIPGLLCSIAGGWVGWKLYQPLPGASRRTGTLN